MADQNPEIDLSSLDLASLAHLARNVSFINETDQEIRIILEFANEDKEVVFTEPFTLAGNEQGQLPFFQEGTLSVIFPDEQVKLSTDSNGIRFPLPESGIDVFIHIKPDLTLEVYAQEREQENESTNQD